MLTYLHISPSPPRYQITRTLKSPQALSEAVLEGDTAKARVEQAETSLRDTVKESERLRRILGVVEGTGDASVEGAGIALQDRDRWGRGARVSRIKLKP